MGCLFFPLFFLTGLYQLFAIADGIEHYFGWTDTTLAWFIAIFTTYIPFLGTALGIYGALNAWGWELWQTILLFGWWYPLAILSVFIND